MGLKLVSKAERLKYTGDGFEIFFRRITNQERNRIVQRHTNRKGDQDNAAIADEILEKCITGWAGVSELQGDEWKEIPFDLTKVSLIPDEVGGELMELFGVNADSRAVEVGNSASTPGNNTITGASRAGDADKKPTKTTSS